MFTSNQRPGVGKCVLVTHAMLRRNIYRLLEAFLCYLSQDTCLSTEEEEDDDDDEEDISRRKYFAVYGISVCFALFFALMFEMNSCYLHQKDEYKKIA